MGKNTIDLTQNVDDIIKNMASIIENILLQAHPVGSYYFSDDPTDPSELFGGTWEALTPGYTLVAQGKATEQHGSTTWTKEFKAGQKYGEFEHQLTVGELASHEHYNSIWNKNNETGVSGSNGGYLLSGVIQWSNTTFTTAGGRYGDTCGITKPTGNDNYHTNISPCKAVYVWKRIS
ncbi:phage baseplate protein [Megasphaera massiliensis]|uniref:phage baseplate protein n=2 Tax=Megasphaera massiliensis TaxID=1232428 RepID=UPI0025989BA7|nr:hypothetical protein [uncultured Megasphaera sp.]